jgi:micrococcal nuclease
VEGKQVTLIRDVSEKDQYDRLLRYVLINEVFINYELIHQGFAVVATFPPDVACSDILLEAEQLARVEEKGLWGERP